MKLIELIDVIDPNRNSDAMIRFFKGTYVVMQGTTKGRMLEMLGEREVERLHASNAGVYDINLKEEDAG